MAWNFAGNATAPPAIMPRIAKHAMSAPNGRLFPLKPAFPLTEGVEQNGVEIDGRWAIPCSPLASPVDRAPHALGGGRKIDVANPEVRDRIDHRVLHGRRGADRRCLA